MVRLDRGFRSPKRHWALSVWHAAPAMLTVGASVLILAPHGHYP